MKKTEENGRFRLRSQEQADLIEMMAATDRVEMILERDALRDRLKTIPRGKMRLAAAKSNLASLFRDLLDTVPAVQLVHMQNNLKHIKCHIYVGGMATRDKNKVEGRWFNIDEMNVIASAVKSVCEMCSIDDPQEQRQCPYKKLMDCMPADPDESGNSCGWFTRLGRE